MDAACNEMKKATIIRLLKEAGVRIGAVQSLLQEKGETGLTNLTYTIEGKIQRLIGKVR